MINKVTKTVAVAALAGVAMFGLSACSNSTPVPPTTPVATIVPETTPSATTTPGATVIAPITVNLTEINNTTQALKVGEVLNLNVADEDPSVWSGVSSDPTVAVVTEGSNTGSVRMNPGVTGEKAGTSTVTFTNSFTKEAVTFTVVVS